MLPVGKLYVPRRGDARCDGTSRARRARCRDRARHVRGRPRADRSQGICTPNFETTVSAALPERHRRRARSPRETTQLGSAPARVDSVSPAPGVLDDLVAGRREILLLKKSYSVFANPSTEPLLRILDPEEIAVFGVATERVQPRGGCSTAAFASRSSRMPRAVSRRRASRAAPRSGVFVCASRRKRFCSPGW